MKICKVGFIANANSSASLSGVAGIVAGWWWCRRYVPVGRATAEEPRRFTATEDSGSRRTLSVAVAHSGPRLSGFSVEFWPLSGPNATYDSLRRATLPAPIGREVRAQVVPPELPAPRHVALP